MKKGFAILLCVLLLGSNAYADTGTVTKKDDSGWHFVIEKSLAETAKKLIEEETYYLDDAEFEINDILVRFDSVTLKREFKPSGYVISISYQVKNQNSSKATYEFSSIKNNSFEYNDGRTTISTLSSWSRDHATQLSLKPNEESIQLIGDFFASSLLYEKKINGITYGPADIDELYTGQSISIDLFVTGYVGDIKESTIVYFEITL